MISCDCEAPSIIPRHDHPRPSDSRELLLFLPLLFPFLFNCFLGFLLGFSSRFVSLALIAHSNPFLIGLEAATVSKEKARLCDVVGLEDLNDSVRLPPAYSHS